MVSNPNLVHSYLGRVTVFLCHGSLCVWRWTVSSFPELDAALVLFSSSRLALHPARRCCLVASDVALNVLQDLCTLCAPARAPISVMPTASVVVLVAACDTRRALHLLLRVPIPARALVLCHGRKLLFILTPVVALMLCLSTTLQRLLLQSSWYAVPPLPSLPSAWQAGHMPVCVL